MIERQLSQQTLHQGYFLTFVEDHIEIEVEPPIQSRRQYFVHPGGVCIVPVLDDGRVVMVEQFRTPVGKIIYEFPAGKQDTGEAPLKTAQRELQEETGYIASEWTELGGIYPSPGYCTETLHMFLARGLSEDEKNPDHGEILENKYFTIEEAISKVMNGEIKDSKTIAGLFYLQNSKS